MLSGVLLFFKQVVDTLVFRVIELSVIELDEQLLTFATLEDFHHQLMLLVW